jgi:hypothetical protein
MGAPSQQQIDEAIVSGLANGWSEGRILRHLQTLERMTDEETDAYWNLPSPPRARPAKGAR